MKTPSPRATFKFIHDTAKNGRRVHRQRHPLDDGLQSERGPGPVALLDAALARRAPVAPRQSSCSIACPLPRRGLGGGRRRAGLARQRVEAREQQVPEVAAV